MAMCTAGKEIPGQDLTPLKLLVDDSWGELWRAQHKMFGTVLFAAYSTSQGMELFQKAYPTLLRMHEGGGVATTLLLKVKAIFPDEAVPYTLLEDPAGKTFGEFAADETKIIDHEKIMSWGATMLDQLIQVMNMNATPLGLTPHTILYDAEMKDTTPWRVAPILPGVAEQGRGLANGRYSPVELLTSSQPQFVNADTYALMWLLLEAMAKDFELDRDPMIAAEVLTASPKLLTTVMLGFQSAGGMYPDSATISTQIRRWIRADAAGDLKKVRKAQEKEKKQIEAALKKGVPVPSKQKKAKASGRSEKVPAANRTSSPGVAMRHPGVITGVEHKGPGIAGLFMSLGKVLGFFGVIALIYFGGKAMVTTPMTTKTASGTAKLFLQAAILERDPAAAMKLSTVPGDASGLVSLINGMEANHSSAKINGYHSMKIDMQAGNKFLSEVMISSETEASVIVLYLMMEKQGDGNYAVTMIDPKPLGGKF